METLAKYRSAACDDRGRSNHLINGDLTEFSVLIENTESLMLKATNHVVAK